MPERRPKSRRDMSECRPRCQCVCLKEISTCLAESWCSLSNKSSHVLTLAVKSSNSNE